MSVTRPFHNRIAVVMDFDWTLAEDSITALLKVLGFSRDDWQKRFVDPCSGPEWDQIVAHCFALIRAGEAGGRRLDAAAIREAGEAIEGFPGVADMPDRLQKVAEEIAPGVRLDFTVLSAGFVDILEHVGFLKRFDRIWGSAFHLDEEGRVVFLKRTITHPEKALYLAALSKGLPIAGSNAPDGTTRYVDEEDKFVPVDQMIYVGDGASDLEAFQFVEKGGGLCIAIRKDGRFGAADQMLPDQRPDALREPSYEEGSGLLEALERAVRSHAGRVALRGGHAEAADG